MRPTLAIARFVRTLLAGGVHPLLCGVLCGGVASGDVIVLANRTAGTLQVQFQPLAGQAQLLTLPAGAVIPMFLDGSATASFTSLGSPKRYQLDPNCAYFFGRGIGGRVDLQKIGLGEDASTAGGRSLPGSASRTPSATIRVKILVDEEEPGRQVYWERRLQRRIEAASAILEAHCRVGLRVVAVGTWNSDNRTNDFTTSLAEFEREVEPAPAQLAIGFTSQWEMTRGRTHMAGTRGPLHTHILVREGSPQISEPEKLEFLVHELGHFLGASHSPEPGSVMRPVLGDNLAGRAGFHIQFDPVNTLIIALVGEEIRRRNVARVQDLTPDSRRRLQQIYVQLSRSLPNDPAGMHYVQLMGASPATPLAGPAKQVLQAIVRAAVANRALPLEMSGGERPARRSDDALTEWYVRHAARAADGLPDNVAPRALLVALGVAMDDSGMLTKIPAAGGLYRVVEPPDEQVIRLSVIGKPTVRGRRDLAQHFFVSGYLTAVAGAEAANAAGIAKELLDSHGASGFSFADVAADRAGVRFAEGVLSGRFPLHLLGQSFSVAAFMPELQELPEGLSAVEVASRYGAASDPRFQKQLNEIDQRVLLLPPHRMTARPIAP
jgi:hypothetical protein